MSQKHHGTSKLKKDPAKLDLACGNNLQSGFTGIDVTKKGTQADIEFNLLAFPWPFKDNSIKEVFASHFLEHIPHGDGYRDPFFDFFNEVYRILKLNGIARFICPYYSSIRAWQDPTHQRAISEATFLYVSKKWRKLNKLEHYPIKCDFEVIKFDHGINMSQQGKSQDAIQYSAMHDINIIDDIIVTLKKIV